MSRKFRQDGWDGIGVMKMSKEKIHLQVSVLFRRRLLLMVLDILSIMATAFLGLLIRFDFSFGSVPAEFLNTVKLALPYTIVITIVIFTFFRLYQSLWAFAGEQELKNLVAACIVSDIVNMVVLHFCKKSATAVPRSYYFIYVFVLIAFVFITRFSYRFLRTAKHKHEQVHNASAVMIIGAGEAGNTLVREITLSGSGEMLIKCIIDDDPKKWGSFIQGIRVIGGRDKISECADLYGVDEIIVAIPSLTGHALSELLNICKETNCRLRVLPSVYQLASGEVDITKLREVDVEDLLGRDPIEIDFDSIAAYVKDRTVLVTGGGGSIGSELCRQIAGHKPKRLIVFDFFENNAYDLQQELKISHPELELIVRIGSIRDQVRVNWLFETYKPEIVYHAAAHKHVPLMEDSPGETIKNNILGTYNCAKAAGESGAKRFVMISTDKAVNPTNIMGASKRACEMIIQTLNRKYDTEFVAVRFGNVLGSSGSVIPLFKKQIAAGGPVTVTDPEIIRYFMTIQEAVSLVLQAGAYAKGGEIFVLDMGEPVRILDLAENLIKLSGYRVGADIQIVFTGLRPGEKLFEEMLMDEEGLQDTENKMIHIGYPIKVDEETFFEKLEALKDIPENDTDEVRRRMKDLVPTYYEPDGK